MRLCGKNMMDSNTLFGHLIRMRRDTEFWLLPKKALIMEDWNKEMKQLH